MLISVMLLRKTSKNFKEPQSKDMPGMFAVSMLPTRRYL